MLDNIEAFLTQVRQLQKQVAALDVLRVTRKGLRNQIEAVAQSWFSDFEPWLRQQPVSEETVGDYSRRFERLLRLSGSNNLKSSYEAELRPLTRNFRRDFILRVRTARPSQSGTTFSQFLDELPDDAEKRYLAEAIGCANDGYLKAAVVLGWSATIDRIHRKIEQIGFDQFNVTAARISSETRGRFKRFSKSFAVSSLSEIRLVFDTDILWVLEGLTLIDSNEHTRLRSCFDMRCHSAHPGDAPITEYNVMSFFSDVLQIVLRNQKFTVPNPEANTS